MTRKHFILIAKAIHSIPDHATRAKFALEMAAECAKTNPRFDNARFLTACGVEG